MILIRILIIVHEMALSQSPSPRSILLYGRDWARLWYYTQNGCRPPSPSADHPDPAVSRSQSQCLCVVGAFVVVFRSVAGFPQSSCRPGLLYAFFSHPLNARPIDKTQFCISDDVKRPQDGTLWGPTKKKFVSVCTKKKKWFTIIYQLIWHPLIVPVWRGNVESLASCFC